MRVFRLCRAAFRALDGEGARLAGGRWNSPGHAVVYTSSALSLAAMEYLVHVDPAMAPVDLVALTIEMPDSITVETIQDTALPKRWYERGSSERCAELGDAWLRDGRTGLLRVPSAVVQGEFNFLLNPVHAHARKARVVAEKRFRFDGRLKRST